MTARREVSKGSPSFFSKTDFPGSGARNPLARAASLMKSHGNATDCQPVKVSEVTTSTDADDPRTKVNLKCRGTIVFEDALGFVLKVSI